MRLIHLRKYDRFDRCRSRDKEASRDRSKRQRIQTKQSIKEFDRHFITPVLNRATETKDDQFVMRSIDRVLLM